MNTSFLSLKSSLKPLTLCLAVLGLGASATQAAPYYWQLTTANIDNTDWNNSTPFNTAQDGTGSSAVGFSGTNEYHVESGKGIRTPNGASTFSGTLNNAPLYLDGGWLRVRGASGHSVATLNLTTSSRIYVQDGSVSSLTATILNNSAGTTNLEANSGGGALVFTLNVGTLSGSGNFALNTTAPDPLAKTISLNITTASAWTGNITWADTDTLVLDFGANTTFGGSLTALGTSRINLDQNVTFAAVTLNGTNLDPGTYSYSYLNSNFDTIFLDGGSGSITVVPEPATAVCFLGGFGLLMLARRRTGARIAVE
jgi:hypothetical protein